MTSASAEDIESTPAPTAKRRLWDIQPSRVDVVDAPANLEPWLVIKSEGSMSDVQNEENLLDVLAGIKQELLALKEAQTPAPPVEVEKAQSGPIVREVAERAASLAAAMEAAEPDPQKLNAEVEALVALLMGIVDKYPKPEADGYPAPDKYPEPMAKACAEGECMGAAAIREVAEKAMSLANALDSDSPPDQAAMIEEVKWLIEALQATAEKYPPIDVQDACASAGKDKEKVHKEEPSEILRKAAADLYLVYAELESTGDLNALKGVDAVQSSLPMLTDVAKAEAQMPEDITQIKNLLCTTIAKAGAIATVWAVEACQEQRDKDLATLAASLEVLIKAIPSPEAKAADAISEAILDLVEKAKSIEAQAKELNCVEEDLSLLSQAQETLDALQIKYVGVQKAAAAPDIVDMASLFSANRVLDQLNRGLQKLGFVAKETKETEETKAADAATAAPVDNPFEAAFKVLSDKVDAIVEKLSKAEVAKSVDSIPGPAAAGMKSAPGKPHDDFPACPGNYNDPAYRALLKARGLDLGRR